MLVAVADSAPLPVGAAMYVDADGAIEGSISGGCVESAVVHEAMAVLAGGRRRSTPTGYRTSWPAPRA